MEQKDSHVKRQLIHDLQTFLWRFELGGYSQESMQEVLKELQPALEDDVKPIGGELQSHLFKMLKDCHLYVEGKGDPRLIVRDLDQLRRDLEEGVWPGRASWKNKSN